MTASAKGTIENPGTNVAAKSGGNRRIQDQGWGEFDRQLAYKMDWRGGKLLRVDPEIPRASATRVITSPKKTG
jgi:putative transposase